MKGKGAIFGWLVVFGGAVALVAWLWIDAVRAGKHEHDHRDDPPLPALATVPDFALEDRSGRAIEAGRDLRGRVWVADFIFTSCAGTCPRLTGRMLELQRAHGARDDFRLVSITVDPETDTAERLARFASDYGASADNWFFLRGEKAKALGLAREGFKLGAETPGAGVPEEMIHSNRLILVDRDLKIRGFYDGTDDAAIARLAHDVERVLVEGPPPGPGSAKP